MDGHVCLHTINVLYCLINDRDYSSMSPEEQNILQWAALLHDINKLGPPVHEGKDHMHPFKGAATVLRVFTRLGLIELKSEKQQFALLSIYDLLFVSKQPVHESWSRHFKSGEIFCKHMQAHD